MAFAAGRADHRAMLQLEKEVDILMAQVGAGAPVADSKLLLHDIAVSSSTIAALMCRSCVGFRMLQTLHDFEAHAGVRQRGSKMRGFRARTRMHESLVGH